MTQNGQLHARSHVEQMWNLNSDVPIFKIPPSNHFYNLDEAAIKLVYASNLEHEITLIHLNRLHNVQHNISLLTVPELSILLAAVQFGKLNEKFTPNSMVDKVPNTPDTTQCKVSVDQTDRAHSINSTAISVPSVMVVPMQYDLLLLLSPSKPGFNVDLCVNPLSLRQKAEESFSCKIKFELSTSNVKAQTHAINTFCTPAFSRLPESEIREQYQAILRISNWNDSQTATFQMQRQLPGNGFAFFEGIFGCGKTFVQATISKLLAALGKHVLIVSTSNAALCALSKSLVEVAPELNADRVVFAGAEEVGKFGRVEQVDQEVENAEFSMVPLRDL